MREYASVVRDRFNEDRKRRFHDVKPKTQSRLTCASTRRASARTHVLSSTRGSMAARRCLGCLLHRGGSGMPTPYGNTKGKANPKYVGWNWSNNFVPVYKTTSGSAVSAVPLLWCTMSSIAETCRALMSWNPALDFSKTTAFGFRKRVNSRSTCSSVIASLTGVAAFWRCTCAKVPSFANKATISAGTPSSGNCSARSVTASMSTPLYAGWPRDTMAAIKPTTTWRRTTAWWIILCGTVAPSCLFPTLIRTAILSRNSSPTCGRRHVAAAPAVGFNLSSSDKRSSHCSGKVVAFPFAHRRWRFIKASCAKLRSDRYRHSMLKHVNAVKHGLALKTSKTVHCSA